MKKGIYPISSFVKLHTKKFEDPQNDKKKIRNSETSKYKNKNFSERKANIPFLSPYETSHNVF